MDVDMVHPQRTPRSTTHAARPPAVGLTSHMVARLGRRVLGVGPVEEVGVVSGLLLPERLAQRELGRRSAATVEVEAPRARGQRR